MGLLSLEHRGFNFTRDEKNGLRSSSMGHPFTPVGRFYFDAMVQWNKAPPFLIERVVTSCEKPAANMSFSTSDRE